MAIRFALPLAAFILVSAGAVAAGAQPGAAAVKPPANDDCVACHDDVDKPFASSIHAAAAACVDCHADLSRVQEFPHSEKVAKVSCAACHDDIASQYHDGIHAWAKEKAGLKMAPSCADCHGAHEILPASNPASMIAKGKLVETCSSCHKGANEKFVQYDPHPNPRSHARSPLLWWINQFYTVLITGCFAVFGLHSLLWFRRERQEKRRS